MKLPTIGVVGGVGPLAGATLVQRIYEGSGACCDQSQPRVLLASYPAEIADRTAYLLGESSVNPAHGLSKVLGDLRASGATVAGIACVTAHAQSIYSQLKPSVSLVSLTEEVRMAVAELSTEKLGVLSTLGTYRAGIFQDLFASSSCQPLFPDAATRERVHQAIYGLKSSRFEQRQALGEVVRQAAEGLIRQGAEAVLLGCTELPLLLSAESLQGAPLLDPLKILAQALRREYDLQNSEFLDRLHRACSKICCGGSLGQQT